MPSVADLLQEHPYLSLQPNNRILCSITKHEMPPTADTILSHINGKKFKKALEWYKYDYSVYEPYIVPHKSDSKKLFCTLTKMPLNKIPDEVKKHFEGKRFQRLKEEFDNKQKQKSSKTVSKEVEESEAEDDEDSEEGFWKPDFSSEDEDDEELDQQKKKRKRKEEEVDDFSDLIGDEEDEEDEDDDEEDESELEEEEEEEESEEEEEIIQRKPIKKVAKESASARHVQEKVTTKDAKTSAATKPNPKHQGKSKPTQDIDDSEFIVRKDKKKQPLQQLVQKSKKQKK